MNNSKTTRFEGRHFLALLAFVMLLWVARPALGQTTLTQPGPTGPPTIQPRDDDTTQRELASFDKFLDSRPEVAEQLRKDPSLINNEEFGERHPGLQEYLQQHPRIREEINENPNAFMRREDRFEQREDQGEVRDRDRDRDQDRDRDRERDSDRRRDFDRDRDRHQVAIFDQFLDRHPELAEQLRKDPSLVNNEQFVQNHPALQQFLRDNPGVGTEINENPRAFMHEEERFDRNEDRFNRSDDRSDQTMNRDERTNRDQSATGDRDMRTATSDRDQRAATGDRDERATTDRDQRATAVDRDQSATGVDRDDLVNGKTVVGARAEGSTTDRDATTSQLASTDRFLDSHPEIAEQLQKNPSLLDDKKFVKNHPALQDFLKTHPEIRAEVRQNPNEFMRQEARFDQREALSTRSMDRDMASFSTFLGGHAVVAQELSKNPSLANNKEFQASHPELQEFLKTHPAVQAQLTSNPATVMNSVQATNAATASATNPASTGKPASTKKPPSTTKPPSVTKPPSTTVPNMMH